jgi:hypothetical protein
MLKPKKILKLPSVTLSTPKKIIKEPMVVLMLPKGIILYPARILPKTEEKMNQTK